MLPSTLRPETDGFPRAATDRGPYQNPLTADLDVPQAAEKSILDVDDDFRAEDLYLDIGVGD